MIRNKTQSVKHSSRRRPLLRLVTRTQHKLLSHRLFADVQEGYKLTAVVYGNCFPRRTRSPPPRTHARDLLLLAIQVLGVLRDHLGDPGSSFERSTVAFWRPLSYISVLAFQRLRWAPRLFERQTEQCAGPPRTPAPSAGWAGSRPLARRRRASPRAPPPWPARRPPEEHG